MCIRDRPTVVNSSREKQRTIPALRNKASTAESELAIAPRTNYNRSAKPYLDARNTLRQAENYTHFDEIKELYNEIRAKAVSYTHLDVYKRQIHYRPHIAYCQ